ncbi:MAG: DotI/IcmL/TraM family protein [Alphaproteobacteria bacterium]
MTPPATPPAQTATKVPPKAGAANAPQRPLPSPVSDIIQNEDAVDAKHQRMTRFIVFQSYVIAALACLLILGIPFSRPIYQYYAKNKDTTIVRLTPLTMPNMTNHAILSWSTTAVTEIMTIGFGDFEVKLKSQRPRFTPDGWEGFAKAFDRQKIGQSFKENQLVLTAVPSNTPVILAQGVNEKNIYQWRVQMPVIMTYATNNDITQRKNAVITIDIVRVAADQNPSGIGINTWTINN